MKIEARQILDAICEADAFQHPSQQAWIDGDTYGMKAVVLDGHFDLELVAEMLTASVEKGIRG